MDQLEELERQQQRVNDYLLKALDQLPQVDNMLTKAMCYGLLLGGKRLRPQLVYLVGSLLNVPLELLDAPAAAVECIHAYSLIHDDLPSMDDSPLRRGKPSVHVKFGEAHAVLAGDALQTLAFSILSQAKLSFSASVQLDMLRLLAQASGASGLCMGQSLDLQAENRLIDLAGLERTYYYKTTVLIRCAVLFGFLASENTDPSHMSTLDEFAHSLGLAFQIQDDLLDITGSIRQLGKLPHSDQARGKKTYPVLLGIQPAQLKVQSLHNQALEALNQLPYNTTSLEKFTNCMLKQVR